MFFEISALRKTKKMALLQDEFSIMQQRLHPTGAGILIHQLTCANVLTSKCFTSYPSLTGSFVFQIAKSNQLKYIEIKTREAS